MNKHHLINRKCQCVECRQVRAHSIRMNVVFNKTCYFGWVIAGRIFRVRMFDL